MRTVEEIRTEKASAEAEETFDAKKAIKCLHELSEIEKDTDAWWLSLPLERRQEICNAERDGMCIAVSESALKNIENGETFFRVDKVHPYCNEDYCNGNCSSPLKNGECGFKPRIVEIKSKTVWDAIVLLSRLYTTPEAAEAALKGEAE